MVVLAIILVLVGGRVLIADLGSVVSVQEDCSERVSDAKKEELAAVGITEEVKDFIDWAKISD